MDAVLDAAISKGLAKGREEAEVMLILKMHKKGSTSGQIAEIMEKSIEEVEAVIRKGKPVLV